MKVLIEQKGIGRKKVAKFFVIFAHPTRPRGPLTKYIDKHGTVTEHKKQAARFLTVDEAEAFAAFNGIEPTDIHIEYFAESDM